jgi:hypothetical protein
MNSIIKIFNYNFYLKEFLVLFFCYLFFEGIFSWLFIPVSDIVLGYEKIAGFVIYGYMLYTFLKLTVSEQVYVVIFSLLIVKLVVESLYKYDTFFQQLTMYYVLFPVVFTLFIKHICREIDLDPLEFIAKFYLFTYIVFMIAYGRGFSFSLEGVEMDDYGPFSGDSRIIHARSIYMMIIPFLWYLHKYINTRKITVLIPVFFCVLVIIIHQHRSVWSCTILSLLIYISLIVRVNKKALPRVWGLIFGGIIIAAIAYVFISTMFPDLVSFFGDRFSEIFDPTNENSTGKFRAEQREVYGKLFLQRPIWGWTFEGFEMTNPMVDWWPEKTGQHFHEGYIEMLFYQGIVGLVFKYSILVYVAYKAFSKKISDQSVILIAFCLSGLLFSFNYVPPLIYWGHVGMCLYYIEKDEKAYDKEELEDVLNDSSHVYMKEELLIE